MKKNIKSFLLFIFEDINFLALVIVTLLMTLLLSIFLITEASASGRVKTVYLDETRTEQVLIKPGMLTAIHFPVKPENSALGQKDLFSLTYIDNDIIVGALRPQAHTNMFVYLYGRRFSFELITSSGVYDEIINVRDASEKSFKPKTKRKLKP